MAGSGDSSTDAKDHRSTRSEMRRWILAPGAWLRFAGDSTVRGR